MRLDGIYETKEAHVPRHVRATGRQDEWDKLSAPVTPAPVYEYIPHSITGWPIARPTGKQSADLPPDRDLVRDVARVVEIECDDGRLIDWMAGRVP
jgi:hypothetical protein